MTAERTAADYVRELTEPYVSFVRVHRRPQVPIPTTLPASVAPWWVEYGPEAEFVHRVRHPGLLDQLARTVQQTSREDVIRGGRSESKPACRMDCLALLERVEKVSAAMAADLGLPRLPLTRRLQRIGGAATADQARTIRSWWSTARVLTQHDDAPLAPDVDCPECGRRSTLRVRLDPDTAVCVHCLTVWEDDPADVYYFGRLVVWVRWRLENPDAVVDSPTLTEVW